MPRTIAAVLLVCLACLTAAPLVPASGGTVAELEPASTRVGIARVKLRVTDLHRESEDTIVGNYAIKIPLAPWRNDRGAISLHAPVPLDDLSAARGSMIGNGLSADGTTHKIVCVFESDGIMAIHISATDHDLSFRTRYELFSR